VLHAFDAAKSAHGYELLTVDSIVPGAVPRVGIDNLWLVWEEGYTGDYWRAMRERYGLHEAPFENDGLPLGVRLGLRRRGDAARSRPVRPPLQRP